MVALRLIVAIVGLNWLNPVPAAPVPQESSEYIIVNSYEFPDQSTLDAAVKGGSWHHSHEDPAAYWTSERHDADKLNATVVPYVYKVDKKKRRRIVFAGIIVYGEPEPWKYKPNPQISGVTTANIRPPPGAPNPGPPITEAVPHCTPMTPEEVPRPPAPQGPTTAPHPTPPQEVTLPQEVRPPHTAPQDTRPQPNTPQEPKAPQEQPNTPQQQPRPQSPNEGRPPSAPEQPSPQQHGRPETAPQQPPAPEQPRPQHPAEQPNPEPQTQQNASPGTEQPRPAEPPRGPEQQPKPQPNPEQSPPRPVPEQAEPQQKPPSPPEQPKNPSPPEQPVDNRGPKSRPDSPKPESQNIEPPRQDSPKLQDIDSVKPDPKDVKPEQPPRPESPKPDNVSPEPDSPKPEPPRANEVKPGVNGGNSEPPKPDNVSPEPKSPKPEPPQANEVKPDIEGQKPQSPKPDQVGPKPDSQGPDGKKLDPNSPKPEPPQTNEMNPDIHGTKPGSPKPDQNAPRPDSPGHDSRKPEPNSPNPEPLKPEADALRPETPKPDSSKPDSKLDSIDPDTSRPRPEPLKPEPDALKPEPLRPDSPRPDSVDPNINGPKPEPPKADPPKIEPLRPDAPKPDTPKPPGNGLDPQPPRPNSPKLGSDVLPNTPKEVPRPPSPMEGGTGPRPIGDVPDLPNPNPPKTPKNVGNSFTNGGSNAGSSFRYPGSSSRGSGYTGKHWDSPIKPNDGLRRPLDPMSWMDQAQGYDVNAIEQRLHGEGVKPKHWEPSTVEQLDGAIFEGPHDVDKLPDNIDGRKFGEEVSKKKKGLGKKILDAIKKIWNWVKENVRWLLNKISSGFGTKVIGYLDNIASAIGKALGPVLHVLEKAGKAIARGWKAIAGARVGKFLLRSFPWLFRLGERFLSKVGGPTLLVLGAVIDTVDLGLSTWCAVGMGTLAFGPDPFYDYKLSPYCQQMADDLEWFWEAYIWIGRQMCKVLPCPAKYYEAIRHHDEFSAWMKEMGL